MLKNAKELEKYLNNDSIIIKIKIDKKLLKDLDTLCGTAEKLLPMNRFDMRSLVINAGLYNFIRIPIPSIPVDEKVDPNFVNRFG